MVEWQTNMSPSNILNTNFGSMHMTTQNWGISSMIVHVLYIIFITMKSKHTLHFKMHSMWLKLSSDSKTRSMINLCSVLFLNSIKTQVNILRTEEWVVRKLHTRDSPILDFTFFYAKMNHFEAHGGSTKSSRFQSTQDGHLVWVFFFW